ncbi:MAG TPA: GDP-mannose 4,6-dehydratase [Solirubrobacteraceae bacterium]
MASQPRRALITGLTGQDGSFLAELLLGKGYEVTGVVRGGTGRELGCAEHLRGRVGAIDGDLLNTESLRAAVEHARPDEIYHLGSPSFVPTSWERPEETMRAILGSTAALLEVVRDLKQISAPNGSSDRDEGPRVFVAGSGAMFGDTEESPQSEGTPCSPTSPYAIAKLAAHQLVGAMREHDGLWVCSGILFNHESERRSMQFVTRAVARGAAEVKLGLATEVKLGNLGAVRDWSFAGDAMRGAWLMLQQEHPNDYVLASGVGRTVAELVDVAFACVGLQAEGYVHIDPALVRPSERALSVGDPTKARKELGWEPELSFEQLVCRMLEADLRALQADDA